MITVTPAHAHYSRSNQDCDEKQALLSDLQYHPCDYTRHRDSSIRQAAEATREAYHLDRPEVHMLPASNAHLLLNRLYQRLRAA
jgi:hypothetical protein